MDDLISRQAAIDAILHNQEVYSHNFGDDPIDKYTIAIIDNDAQTIAQLPSAQKTGRWIDGQCSVCGCDVPAYIVDWKWQKDMDANFCPNCGSYNGGGA